MTSLSDNIARRGFLGNLFSSDQLVTCKEDCANSYSRVYYYIGKSILERTMDTIRKEAEKADKGLQVSCPPVRMRTCSKLINKE
jgi:hypothetical protein